MEYIKGCLNNAPLLNNQPQFTRRQVLIWSGTATGFTVLSPIIASGDSIPLIIMEKAKGLVVSDPVLCVGCSRCELACTEFNDGKASPVLSKIKVDRNLNYYASQGSNDWSRPHGNMGDGLIIQDLCKQCPHPVPCADICPEDAIVLSPVTNARMINADKCTGCRICLRACPWEMISFDPESRKAVKCHLCEGKPKCVKACPSGALKYVPWHDLTHKTPVRNKNTAAPSTQRIRACNECHLPSQPKNALSVLKGADRFSISGLIELSGLILLPVTIGSVLFHSVLRRFTKE